MSADTPGAPPVPDDLREAEALLRGPKGLGDAEGAGFAEPWQAQAFACALQLSRQGLFKWSEWVEVFSTEIKASPAHPGESSNAAYYRQWLAALETIVARKGAASTTEIDRRQEAWRQAYLNTPHGQPVDLANATTPPAGGGHPHHHHDDDDHDHDHDHPHDHAHHQHGAPAPIAVSPATKRGA